MEWLVESMSTVTFLLVKLFMLIKLPVLFGLRAFCISFLTWMEILRNSICLHFSIFWRLTTSIIAILFLPVRVLNALQNERRLEMHIQEMQNELENLVWDKKGLEKQLCVAIKEHKMMAVVLRELEDEHDEAIVKIEQLEDELGVLKEENQHLKETLGKARWSHREQVGPSSSQNQSKTDKPSTLVQRPSRAKTSRKSQEITRADAWEDESKTKLAARQNQALFPKQASLDTAYLRDQRRQTALLRSLFSAVLSIVVGTTVWTAEDPCMPLVLALFAVVSMSLRSVVQFFSTIKNNHASEAVALLSFNCFILGTLTYPTLPNVARMLSPLAWNFSDKTLRFLSNCFHYL